MSSENEKFEKNTTPEETNQPSSESEGPGAETSKEEEKKEENASKQPSRLSPKFVEGLFKEAGEAKNPEEFIQKLAIALFVATSPAFWIAFGGKEGVKKLANLVKNAIETYKKNHPEDKDQLEALENTLFPPSSSPDPNSEQVKEAITKMLQQYAQDHPEEWENLQQYFASSSFSAEPEGTFTSNQTFTEQQNYFRQEQNSQQQNNQPTEPKKDYYDILNVNQNATPSEIRQAYLKKARELHPDKNPGDPNATEKFQNLQEAYETLNDPEKRANYDKDYKPAPSRQNSDAAEATSHASPTNVSDNSDSVRNNLNSTVESNQTKTHQENYQIEGENDLQEQQYQGDLYNGSELISTVAKNEGTTDLTNAENAGNLTKETPSKSDGDPLDRPLEHKSTIEPEGDEVGDSLTKDKSEKKDNVSSMTPTPTPGSGT